MSFAQAAPPDCSHRTKVNARSSPRGANRFPGMTQCEGGAVTVRLTVGTELVVLELLEITPLPSTPMMVNVYVFAGVTPFGVLVEVLLLPHAGNRRSVPLRTKRASSPKAFVDRLPPAALNPIRARAGTGNSHKP